MTDRHETQRAERRGPRETAGTGTRDPCIPPILALTTLSSLARDDLELSPSRRVPAREPRIIVHTVFKPDQDLLRLKQISP
jgi:hypothetical protein